MQMLRLVLYVEEWQGVSSMPQRVGKPSAMTESPRARVRDCVGDRHALQLSAVLLHPTDSASSLSTNSDKAADSPKTEGEYVKMYFSQEVEQRWVAGPEDPSDAGITWWLPHSAFFHPIYRPGHPKLQVLSL